MPESLPPQEDNENESMDSNPPESMPSGSIGAGGAAEILSREELRELFSPVSVGPTDTGSQPVLILADTPEDAETLSSSLRELGIQPVLAFSRFMALDLFRERSFQAVVSTPDAWGSDSASFLERFRAVDPDIRFCFVCRRGQAPPLPGADVLERPLGTDSISRLRSILSLPPGTPRAWPRVGVTGLPIPGAISAESSAPHGSGSQPLSPRSAGEPLQHAPPNGLLGVHELLAAALRGESMTDGLRSWALRDPGVLGLVSVRAGEATGELHCVYWAREPQLRSQLIQHSAALLTAVETETVRSVISLEGFYVFPGASGSGGTGAAASDGWTALWHRSSLGGLASDLGPLLPLLRQVGDRSPSAAAAESPGERFARLVWTRMKACERRDSRLLLVVGESQANDVTPDVLQAALAATLRGADWIECVGDRVYGALELHSAGVRAALETRLAGVAARYRMRVVGLPWAPGDGSVTPGAAADCLRRLEQSLASRQGHEFGVWLDAD
ncbi:MAG: hypothetical protein AB7O52_02590 [Planctomycetota bacterium]